MPSVAAGDDRSSFLDFYDDALPQVSPMVGLAGGHELATTLPMYRVHDVEAAVRAIRDAGGTCTDPERFPYGVTANCTDDQGTRFYVGQL
jgi:hypothetical protein